MKDLKKRAREYAEFQWAGHTEDMIQDVKNCENDFYAGAKSVLAEVRERAKAKRYPGGEFYYDDLEKLLSEIEK